MNILQQDLKEKFIRLMKMLISGGKLGKNDWLITKVKRIEGLKSETDNKEFKAKTRS